MRDGAIRVAGLVGSAVCAAAITWVYAHQPRTVAQLTGGISSSVGAYRVDPASFVEGQRYFRSDHFEEARAAFARADPARQDPVTQFYVAYTFYRHGWGRFYNDDALFTKGLEAVDRAIAVAPQGRVAVSDASLQMRTADELRAELRRGLVREASDFDPRRLMQERK